jgi:hypothetical protein
MKYKVTPQEALRKLCSNYICFYGVLASRPEVRDGLIKMSIQNHNVCLAVIMRVSAVSKEWLVKATDEFDEGRKVWFGVVGGVDETYDTVNCLNIVTIMGHSMIELVDESGN